MTDDLADARDQVRWFPAMVSNHVQDLIERYGADGSSVPKALTDYVQARKFYDYNDHSRVGAAHGEFVTDEICDRFCVIGNTEQSAAKLRELEAAGVDQFNVYLMTHAQEETLQVYGDETDPTVLQRDRLTAPLPSNHERERNCCDRNGFDSPLRRGRSSRRCAPRRLARCAYG